MKVMKQRKPFILDLKDLQDWHGKQEITYAQDNRKRMTFTLNGGIAIYTKEEKQPWSESILAWSGMQLFTAVETFNEL